MGIRGLTTFVTEKYREHFYKDYRLHDTYLVIDGLYLMHELFHACGWYGSNSFFGGEYRKYKDFVSEFFDNLEKCHVKPFVLFDGGSDELKESTYEKSIRERLLMASEKTPIMPSGEHLTPLLALMEFKEVLREKEIKFTQTLYKADEHVASVAKILDCPVLSCDSDYLLSGIRYIPFYGLDLCICNKKSKNPYFHCKVIENDYFIEKYRGLDLDVLPLLGVLLGNHDICSSFRFFVANLPPAKTNSFKKIETVLQWLRNKKLIPTVNEIVKNLSVDIRQHALRTIAKIISSYTHVSSSALENLGFTLSEIDDLMEPMSYKTYEYDKIKDCLAEITIVGRDDDIEIEDFKNVPKWFLKKYHNAEFPPSFIDMLKGMLVYLRPDQIEDLNYPACSLISLRIISVIFRLITKGNAHASPLIYVSRGEHTDLEKCELNCSDYPIDFDTPSLAYLQNLTVSQKRDILFGTLRVDQSINKFPRHWLLYVASIKYWLNESDEMFTTPAHLCALVLSIVYHVVVRINKMGEYFDGVPSPNTAICSLLMDIEREESERSERKFAKFTRIAENNKYSRNIVHAFSMFLNGLRESLNLNALLDYPCIPARLSEFFSGVLINNLYLEISSRNCYTEFLMDLFEAEPCVLKLSNILMTNISAMRYIQS
ncbi:hypothetical protein QAD02_024289 [Eretmocerus hayati]|uniref:Uncharacterized protein n=1 Tax=Eretmocerus hayati TaxID=131215 RepID=A0ACC2PY25_9HYME|nr:hypothetical protein QAD02_024289 [Eretmocerus hayati]